MLGAIVGDIVGSTREYRNVKTTDFEWLPANSRPTDDTVMTLAVAQWLMDDPEHIHAGLVKSMQALGRQYPYAGYGGSFVRWLFSENPQPYNSWGNGSAMRVSPVGMYAKTLDEALELAKISAEVSHNHPEGIKGAQAIAACVFMARNHHGFSSQLKDEIRSYVTEKFGYNLKRTIDEIRPTYQFDVSCQGSVPEAIIAYLEGENLEDTIRKAISLGGDSDTIGAMAGSIAKAFGCERHYGSWSSAEEVPQCQEIEALLPEPLRQIMHRFEHFINYPTRYSYPIDYRVFAGEYPNDLNPEVGKRKIERMVHFGITDFVDLTESGELRPYSDLLPAGVRHHRFPIADTHAPASVESVYALLQQIEGINQQEDAKVYLHCWGGVGRTGTIAACYYIYHGSSYDEALERLRKDFEACEKSKTRRIPETDEQLEFIARFARELPRLKREAKARLLDRIKGSLVGGAVGDALGYAVEFMSYDSIVRHYGESGIIRYSLNDRGEAMISDDTQMTLFTANGLLYGTTRGNMRGIMAHPAAYVTDAYLEWLKTQGYGKEEKYDFCWLLHVPGMFAQRAPGNTCLSALHALENRKTVNNNSCGCGGVMRVAPVALHYRNIDIKKVLKLGGDCAEITHKHPQGYLPAAWMTDIIYRLLQATAPVDRPAFAEIVRQAGHDVAEVYDTLATEVERLRALLDKALTLADNDQSDVKNIGQLGEGWTGHEALAIAVYCVAKHIHDFEGAVVAAVNHSGDSDSTGAICGNIIGAIVGYDQIPQHYLDNLELRPVIEAMAHDLWQGCCISDYDECRRPEQQQWIERYLRANPCLDK